MTKMYCDRCGAEIIENKHAMLCHKTIYAKHLLLYSKYNDWDRTDKILCRRCEDEYIHWFMNPEPPKEE